MDWLGLPNRREVVCSTSQKNVTRYIRPFKQPWDWSQCNHDYGLFSRFKVLKSHLSSMHMEYPPNTRKSEPKHCMESCMGCKQIVSNIDEWIASHLNKGLSPAGSLSNGCLHRKYKFQNQGEFGEIRLSSHWSKLIGLIMAKFGEFCVL